MSSHLAPPRLGRPRYSDQPKRRRRRNQRSTWKKLLWVRQSCTFVSPAPSLLTSSDPDNYVDPQTFLDHLQRNPRLQPYQFWRLVADSTVIVQHVCSVVIFVCCFSGIFQERIAPGTVVGWGSAATVGGVVLWDLWAGTTGGACWSHADRLRSIKSAVLIYCAVLGLSPILKSLTKSTSSDSIWAMSCWLMVINVLFFDYGGGIEAKFPASLSTNAALMASTVLASRLTSTTHVFSLTLFSIQVFGLFPVFRRHLLHVSRTLHNILTLGLLLGAGVGVAVTVSSGVWTAALVGGVLSVLAAAVAVGGASWWLIGLQRWKDEIVGPWDPARPRIKGMRWD